MKRLIHRESLPKKEIIKSFCEKHGIVYFGIFGSFIKNSAKTNSDIDILVEFEANRRLGLTEFIGIEYSLSKLFKRKIDLVTKDALHHLLKDKILREIVTIYEKR